MDKAPDAFRTISEVADDLRVPQHVLRFWETRFSQIKPMKRGGGRRYYRPDDVDLLRGIRHLLYGEGYTIRGVQRLLKDNGLRFVQGVGRTGAAEPPPEGAVFADAESDIEMAAEADEMADETPETDAPFATNGPAVTVVRERRTAPEVQIRPEVQARPELHSIPELQGHPELRAPAAKPPVPAPPPVEIRPAGLADDDRRRLQAALYELAECRRLLNAALEDE